MTLTIASLWEALSNLLEIIKAVAEMEETSFLYLYVSGDNKY